MTSQISMRKLLKLELKQNAWMLALSALAQFLFGPVAILLSVGDGYSTIPLTMSRHCGFFREAYFMAQIFIIILCICFTIFSYRYLFSKRMVDLYHSAPITRGKLFLLKYVHGFLVWFVPFVIFSIITLVISLARLNVHLTFDYLGMICLTFIQTFLLSLFVFFIFYHLYLVAVYLSGNVLNMFTNVAIIGFCVISIYGLVLSCAECYFDTFCTAPPAALVDVLFALSPFAAPFYLYVFYQDNGFTSLFGEHTVLVISCLFISVLLLLLARILCKKRPSELAERGTLNKYYVAPAKIAVSFLAAIAFSLFFGELLYGSSGLLWGLFGVIFGGVLCYGAINSIFHTTIKAFFKNIIPMISVTAAGLVFILAFRCDWFGYDNYLPGKEQIAGVAVFNYSYSDNTQNMVIVNSAPDSISFSYNDSDQRVTQKDLLTDKNVCYDFLDLAVNGRENARPYETSSSYYVKVELESGRTYYRRYNISNKDYEILKPFIESEEYKNTNYKLSSGLLGYPESIDLYLTDSHTSLQFSPDNIKSLMDAFYQDFNEHYTFEELSSFMSSVSLEITFPGNAGGSHYFNLPVPSTYTRTMECLKELYPTYFPYISCPEQIISLTPYMSRSMYQQYGSYERYFEMEGAQAPDWLPGVTEDESTNDSDTEMVIVEEYIQEGAVSITQYTDIKVTVEGVDGELLITDPELIELIFPYLYFGDYHDRLEFRDYIYFAEVRTATSNYTSCYVKPNTVPREILDFLEENVTVEISRADLEAFRAQKDL